MTKTRSYSFGKSGLASVIGCYGSLMQFYISLFRTGSVTGSGYVTHAHLLTILRE